MPEYLSPEKTLQSNGYEHLNDLIEGYLSDGIAPACCSDGCQVEMDGECEHGFKSVLRELGYV